MTCAPAGIAVLDDGPTAVMRAALMMMVWSTRAGVPVPSTSRACVSATTGALTVTNGATPDVSVACALSWSSGSASEAAQRSRIVMNDLALSLFGLGGDIWLNMQQGAAPVCNAHWPNVASVIGPSTRSGAQAQCSDSRVAAAARPHAPDGQTVRWTSHL